MKLLDRFLEKIDQTGDDDACWIWKARKTPQGYGRIAVNGKNKLAHRVAYELFVSAPGALHVLHRCDNPSCVNPKHLWLGTNAENVADKMAKGRLPSAVGSLNNRAKLSDSDVLEIRALALSGVKRAEIAAKFNIAPGYVNQIRAGEAWRHL